MSSAKTQHETTGARRLMILASKLGYQTRSFADAARKLGVEVAFGTDRCGKLDDPWGDGALPLHFEQPEKAAKQIFEAQKTQPVAAILALGDQPTAAAAYAARALGLVHNSPESVLNCRSKLRQREVLRQAALPVPEFFSFSVTDAMEDMLPRVKYPCVIKPILLAASQGVIRANTPQEFTAAVERIRRLLESPDLRAKREPELDRLLVERYVPGGEVAVEALLSRGVLRVLAIFDKPDPLEGPYFEETIYVTPSRLHVEQQQRVAECAARCACALGLEHGPMHAEFRVNADGPWVIELQPRPIGGLCSRALRFGPEKILLEDLLVRHAMGLEGSELERESEASGVMMIPVPQSGTLERVNGQDEAQGVAGIKEIHITARLHDYIAAWPEGSSYLGFIFASGKEPEYVEAALRAAHSRLQFVLAPRLPVEHPARASARAAGRGSRNRAAGG